MYVYIYTILKKVHNLTSVHLNIFESEYIYTYIHIYTYIRTYIHTCIHTCMHTNTQESSYRIGGIVLIHLVENTYLGQSASIDMGLLIGNGVSPDAGRRATPSERLRNRRSAQQ